MRWIYVPRMSCDVMMFLTSLIIVCWLAFAPAEEPLRATD